MLETCWRKVCTMLSPVIPNMSGRDAVGESIIWERERVVANALALVIDPETQPCIYAGRYSWLTPPDGLPLQLDIFYPSLTEFSHVKLAKPTSLAIEIQSTLHDGRWTSSKRRFFKDRAAFERYTAHQEWKRARVLSYGIPFVEIDPSVDDISPVGLRRRIGTSLHLLA